MNVTDAAYHTVHDSAGGAAALASRLKRIDADGNEKPMSEAVLNSKVNPNTKSHHLTLAEAVAVMDLTGDDRILHAIAAQRGYVAIKVDAPEVSCLHSSMLEAGKAKGELSGLLLRALADGKVTSNEADQVALKVMDAIVHFVSVAQQARAQVTPGASA